MNSPLPISSRTWLLLFSGLFLVLAKPTSAQSIFNTPISIPLEQENPTSVTVADMDQSGTLDIIASSISDNPAQWYGQYFTANNQNRVWGQAQNIQTGTYHISQVITADINNDGLPDVVWASRENNLIAWQRNSTQFNGVFYVPDTISVNTNRAESVFAADINGDGDIDVISASSGDNKIAWYENDGEGNFGSQQVISTNASSANFVYAADLDGDNDMDVISTSGLDDKVAWYRNDGSGNFSEQIIITTDLDQANSVFAADLNGDGYIDIAAIGNAEAVLFKNDGSGEFGEKEVFSSQIARGSHITGGDFDQDGDMDLVTVSSLETFVVDYSVAWYENDGVANFGSQNGIISSDNPALYALVEDVDEDGFPDIVTVSFASEEVQLFTNNLTPVMTFDALVKYVGPQAGTTSFNVINEGYGTLQWHVEWVDGGGTFFGVTASGDESTDVTVSFSENETGEERTGFFNIVADNADNTTIQLSIVQSPFLTTDIFGEQIVLSDETAEIRDSYPIDIDGDADIDIITIEIEDGTYQLAWYENVIDNFFREKKVIAERDYLRALHSADLDGDGDNDIITGDDNGKLVIYYNNGEMEFTSPVEIGSGLGRAREFLTVDLDNDGDLDIFGATAGTNQEIFWFENVQNVVFDDKVTITTAVNVPTDIIAADLDEDGDLDLISTSTSDHKVAWYKNDGNGNLGDQIVLTFAPDIFNIDISNPNSVQANDFDGDGDLDLVVGSAYYPRISYLENTGDANFSSDPIVITSGTGGISDIGVADFDFDGDPDLAAVSTYTDEVLVLLNDGDGTVSSNTVLTEDINNPTKVYTLDLDSDGDIDVLASSTGDNKLTWHKNLTINLPTNIESEPTMVQSFNLHQNYPNPFNPSTVISFDLTKASNVSLKVYNLIGQEVGVLIDNQMLTSGQHSYTFNASALTTGVYVYQLKAGGLVSSRKMTLIK